MAFLREMRAGGATIVWGGGNELVSGLWLVVQAGCCVDAPTLAATLAAEQKSRRRKDDIAVQSALHGNGVSTRPSAAVARP